jgi:hypothetical protein
MLVLRTLPYFSSDAPQVLRLVTTLSRRKTIGEYPPNAAVHVASLFPHGAFEPRRLSLYRLATIFLSPSRSCHNLSALPANFLLTYHKCR